MKEEFSWFIIGVGLGAVALTLFIALFIAL